MTSDQDFENLSLIQERDEVNVLLQACPSSLIGWAPKVNLAPSAIHVWIARNDFGTADVEYLASLLSEDEAQKAARFHFCEDSGRSITSRGLLRLIGSGYLGIGPSEIQFSYGDKGKPSFAPEINSDVRFSLAHSGMLILLAFARGQNIGIDVEQVRDDRDSDGIAERFFSVAEWDYLRALPRQQRHQEFFRCWTLKEAYVKALGDGLSLPLNQFSVSMDAGGKFRRLRAGPGADETRRWLLRELTVPAGYAAAIAVERHIVDRI